MKDIIAESVDKTVGFVMNLLQPRSVAFECEVDDPNCIPRRGDPGAAGFDLYSPIEFEIQPQDKVVVPLGMRVAIPRGFYGRIASRSSLSVKNDLEVGAGVVDNSYRGELCVVLRNFGKEKVVIGKYDRIAQLIIEPYHTGELVCSNVLDHNGNTTIKLVRLGGFGSTGK